MKIYVCTREEALRRADDKYAVMLVHATPERIFGEVLDGEVEVTNEAVRVYSGGYIVPFFAIDCIIGG